MAEEGEDDLPLTWREIDDDDSGIHEAPEEEAIIGNLTMMRVQLQ
jgi:hypothetical protein